MKCLTCGATLPESNFKKGGRPRLYCSSTCSDTEKYFLALEKSIRQTTFDKSHKSLLAGRLFRLRNELSGA